jgi:hypothetical protein
MNNQPNNNNPPVAQRRAKRELLKLERYEVYALLKHKYNNNRLAHGTINAIADTFLVSRSCIERIWYSLRENITDGHFTPVSAIESGKKLSGISSKYPTELLRAEIATIPHNERTSIVQLADHFSGTLSYTTVKRLINHPTDPLALKTTVNTVPILTEENRNARLTYCLSKVEENGHFSDFENCIMLDEKMFTGRIKKQSTFLVPGEQKPYNQRQNKSRAVQVMCLVATARPKWDDDGELIFDGKIGVYPFVEQVPAQRNSVNRPRGTLETKNVSVTKELFINMLIEKVIPDLLEKCPDYMRQNVITLQLDNAPVHGFKENSPELDILRERCRPLNLAVEFQPANSPDTNINDLGLLRAVDCMVQKRNCNTINGLNTAIRECYFELDPRKLEYIYVSHQHVLNKIIVLNGGNFFSVPHINKAKLDREGILPRTIQAVS